VDGRQWTVDSGQKPRNSVAVGANGGSPCFGILVIDGEDGDRLRTSSRWEQPFDSAQGRLSRLRTESNGKEGQRWSVY
jgi:hypothetical protein